MRYRPLVAVAALAAALIPLPGQDYGLYVAENGAVVGQCGAFAGSVTFPANCGMS